MCNVNVVNRKKVVLALYFFLEGIWGGFGHPGHPLIPGLHNSSVVIKTFFRSRDQDKTTTLAIRSRDRDRDLDKMNSSLETMVSGSQHCIIGSDGNSERPKN